MANQKIVLTLHPNDPQMVQIFSEDKNMLFGVMHVDCFEGDLAEKICQDQDVPDAVECMLVMV